MRVPEVGGEPACHRRVDERPETFAAYCGGALVPCFARLWRRMTSGVAKRERRHAFGVIERELLRDHAAHRHADEMRMLDASGVEKRIEVGGEIREAEGLARDGA